jgi:hypothetical protein
VGEIRRYGEGGYWRITGDTVQPGGFITAARLELAVERIDSLSGEFYEDGQERSGVLAERLGEGFHFQPNRDHLQTEWVQTRKQSGLEQVAVMAVATAVAFYTGGAAASALGFAQGTTGYAIASASIGSMAGSAVSGAISGNFDLHNVLKSGLASGLTAGLTQWAGQALGNNTLLNTQQVGDVLKAGETATDLTDKLVGYTVRAGISASVNQVVYGKQAGSFGQAFVNSFVASEAADAAKFIGDNTGLGKPLGEMGSPGHLLAHAALGCAAAALSGHDCAAGAIGGGMSAFAGSLLPDPVNQTQRALMAGALTFIGGATAQAAGYDGVTAAQAATNEAVNNRIMHWRDFEKAHAQCQNAPGADGCHTVLKMGGQHSGVLPDFLQLPESQVVANSDATGRVVSYTIVDKQSGQPLLIMGPAEYQAYRNAPLATRGQYLLAPQWSLDLGSAVVYAGLGDARRAQEHVGYVLASPEYWLTLGAGAAGAVVGRTAVPWLGGAQTALEAMGSRAQIRIVIGENQARVDDFATRVGGETISDWLRRTGQGWSPEVNQHWLEQMKSNKALFYDIGPDFERRLMNRIDPASGRPPSQIYGSERKGLSGYPGYIRLYDRAGKYEGGVKDLSR